MSTSNINSSQDTALNQWSILGPDADLNLEKFDGITETQLEIPTEVSLDRKSLEEIKFRTAKYFSKVRVGHILAIGEPDVTDVEVFKKELFHIPFWRVQGSYACRYVRKASYTANVSSDVEEVRISGHSQSIATERRKVSEIVSEIASSSAIPSGLGPIPLTPFQGTIRSGVEKGISSGMRAVLRGRDKEISRKTQVMIEAEEIASYALKAELCFNAHLGVEDKKTLKVIQEASRFEALKPEVASNSLAIHFTRSDALSDLKKEIIKLPDVRPRRILEQVAVANKLELVYVPHFRFVVESKGHRKVVEFNALTGEDYIPRHGFV